MLNIQFLDFKTFRILGCSMMYFYKGISSIFSYEIIIDSGIKINVSPLLKLLLATYVRFEFEITLSSILSVNSEPFLDAQLKKLSNRTD